MVARKGFIANLSMHSLTVQDLRAGSGATFISTEIFRTPK